MPSAEGHERQCVATAIVRQADENGWETPVIDPATGKAVRRRCRRFALRGSTVCDTHATPNAKAAARRRMEYARDLAYERVISELESVDAEIALKAAALAIKHAPGVEAEDPVEAVRNAFNAMKEELRANRDATSGEAA